MEEPEIPTYEKDWFKNLTLAQAVYKGLDSLAAAVFLAGALFALAYCIKLP